jgi:type VI secretion system protein ImpG
MPYGAVLYTEDSIPVSKIYCIQKPTNQIDPPISWYDKMAFDFAFVVELILSLSEGENSVKSLREILGLYNYGDEPAVQQQIMGIRDVKTRKVVRRLGKDSWRGFAQGTEVTVTFDEERFVGGSAFLLASVLNQFFALYSSINSFTELIAKTTQREGVWKKWKPMVGAKELL